MMMVKITAEKFRSLRSVDGRLVRRYGPLPVISKVGKTSTKWRPKWMKVHPVFRRNEAIPPDEEDPTRNHPSEQIDLKTREAPEEKQEHRRLAYYSRGASKHRTAYLQVPKARAVTEGIAKGLGAVESSSCSSSRASRLLATSSTRKGW
ncbi:hypothetical protein FNV43_RR27351 [Rhamnella rubrinervis]|uniref:Uncharacterized protein n=1 Tax=Rhamnella rubrinervis TaxID=2594499 RepID=A0A8K0GPL2_9ROSA|nr:hypothetical protein FNV43_RR27351 [Rhamnella rubrinervis]